MRNKLAHVKHFAYLCTRYGITQTRNSVFFMRPFLRAERICALGVG